MTDPTSEASSCGVPGAATLLVACFWLHQNSRFLPPWRGRAKNAPAFPEPTLHLQYMSWPIEIHPEFPTARLSGLSGLNKGRQAMMVMLLFRLFKNFKTPTRGEQELIEKKRFFFKKRYTINDKIHAWMKWMKWNKILEKKWNNMK